MNRVLLTMPFALSAAVLAGLATSERSALGGDGSVLGGNQVVAPINLPINVCGNAVAVIGIAAVGCKGGLPTIDG